MGFNERTHAFIVAEYYNYLKERFGQRGVQAFIHGTLYYGMQRGRRMAQRCIRDGQPLTQANYNYYGEWVSTEEIKAAGQANKSEILDNGRTLKIIQCPWHEQFKDMDLLEAGQVYCTYVDVAISLGFNPALGYEAPQNLNGADYCIHRVKDGVITEGAEKGKNPAGIRNFEYHCAHAYWSFREVTEAIFGKLAAFTISEQILKDFAEAYGRDMARKLEGYVDTNFNVIG